MAKNKKVENKTIEEVLNCEAPVEFGKVGMEGVLKVYAILSKIVSDKIEAHYKKNLGKTGKYEGNPIEIETFLPYLENANKIHVSIPLEIRKEISRQVIQGIDEEYQEDPTSKEFTKGSPNLSEVLSIHFEGKRREKAKKNG